MNADKLAKAHVLSDEDAQAYLDTGITPNDVVRLRWPDATDHVAHFVLWEKTPFPLVSGLHDIADAVAELPEDARCDVTQQEVEKEFGFA